jgi:hypothetical protein
MVNCDKELLKSEENYLLINKIRNILIEAGISDKDKGKIIPLDEQVKILIDRYRNVINLSKVSYVFNPANKQAKINNPIKDDE